MVPTYANYGEPGHFGFLRHRTGPRSSLAEWHLLVGRAAGTAWSHSAEPDRSRLEDRFTPMRSRRSATAPRAPTRLTRLFNNPRRTTHGAALLGLALCSCSRRARAAGQANGRLGERLQRHRRVAPALVSPSDQSRSPSRCAPAGAPVEYVVTFHLPSARVDGGLCVRMYGWELGTGIGYTGDRL